MLGGVAVGDIKNFVAVGEELATGGQPTAGELADVASSGFEVVVNLGLLDRRYCLPDEEGTARALGLRYHHLPVEFDAPTLEDFRRFWGLMRNVRGMRTFVHCAANYRVSCFTALYGQAELGWTLEQADAHVRRVWEPNDIWSAFMTEVRATIAPAKGGTPA
jgi:protein tyrosine phosphatase (PTP) superfamily phosphohydrolase (DUF442 family)